MLTKTDHGLAKLLMLSSIFVKMVLDTISKNVYFSALVYMHAITRAYNASACIHMIGLRKRDILIEIEPDKLFVMKYFQNDWIHFITIMKAKTDSAVKHSGKHE